jgi:hypothetical protein
VDFLELAAGMGPTMSHDDGITALACSAGQAIVSLIAI